MFSPPSKTSPHKSYNTMNESIDTAITHLDQFNASINQSIDLNTTQNSQIMHDVSMDDFPRLSCLSDEGTGVWFFGCELSQKRSNF